jgi:hypothetical protein
MDKLTVVSFYTDGRYAEYAQQLISSCDRFNIPHHVLKLEDQGRWVLNCAMKGPFMHRMMQRLKRPLLWVDADGTIEQHPVLLFNPVEDFAVRAEPGQRTHRPVGREVRSLPANWPAALPPMWFNTGTIYFAATEKALDILQVWDQLCTARPTDWDQWSLQQAWCDTQPNTLWLPQGYCRIHKMGWKSGEEQSVVIRQGLASVDLKVQRT